MIVPIGQSFTMTCMFQTEPVIGIRFKSLDLPVSFQCSVEAVGDGSCGQPLGYDCAGNDLECSADKKTYHITVNNINETFDDQIFQCEDIVNTSTTSNAVQVRILSKYFSYLYFNTRFL